MADPEEIYKEVLAEEQAKGSSAPVAEGRAKAARQRAHEGSPHPKEAKWWPGSQPQFEGGDGGAPAEAAEEPAEAEEPEVEEAPAAEAPAEEAPAAEAPAAAPAAAPQELTQDQPAAPAAAPVQPAAATAPVPVGVAASTATLPSGVTHGTPAGNRLRPEDAVATESQFDAQAAVRQRRKMIDELVATGVPAVAARSSEKRGGGVGMLLLYLLIPLLAVAFLVSNESELAGAEGGETAQGETGGEGGGGGGLTITAANVAFDTDALTIPADGGELLFVNDDAPSVPHNVAIYEDDSASAEIFVGDEIPGGQEITYEIPAHDPGEYYFQCDVHPAMNGTATFE